MNEATKQNLIRKASLADAVHCDPKRGPYPSWIDLNLTELCNRTCEFCPRSDSSTYPNQDLHMSPMLASKIAVQLYEIKYKGVVVFSGFGEPTLHPNLSHITRAFTALELRVELVTNGDKLNVSNVKDLLLAGVSYFAVSVYEGPEDFERLDKVFKSVGCPEDRYLLRDRWHGKEGDFGLKLTNRAGVVSAGHQPSPNGSVCYYPSYSMMIDWNGDVLLCVQDWNKRVKFGNLHDQKLLDIWFGSKMSKRRWDLSHHGRGCLDPCQKCNAAGTLHGQNHVSSWEQI